MSEYGYRVYEYIVDATNSELILFFLIVAVIVVPLYIVVLKGRKADKAHEREREKAILDVVKENTAVIAGLKVTLDHSGESTKSTLERIHTRIDDHNNMTSNAISDIARINTKFDTSLANQTEMASKINKILLIVSSDRSEN